MTPITRSGLRFLYLAQQVQTAQTLVFGALPDDAGIDDHNVSVITVPRGAVAQLLQLRSQQLRVGHVHLTAECPDMILHDLLHLLTTRIL